MLYSGIQYPRVNRFGEQLKPSDVHYPRELRFGEQTETLRYTLYIHRYTLEAWHTRQCVANVIYDFQKDLTEYCKSDIKLLKQGCLSFKSVFEPLACFNPFSHITIASACNWDLRQNRMEADMIANKPLYGWRLNTNHSRVALEWLHWQ